jgi:formamidopyrimidine-DNA glycosylase
VPELPEVEGYARYLASHALDQKIARVDLRDERILTIPKRRLERAVIGRKFRSVRRHGKHLFASTDGETWLHLHFGMTGDLAYYIDPAKEPRFARVIFDFENGAHLAYEDMRLFGYVDLVRDPDESIRDLGLGPDPLDPAFGLRAFRGLLSRRRGAIKSLLMSQDVIAGLGNLYVDEALFRSSIHPRRPVDGLDAEEARTLFSNIRRILQDVIARHARGADLSRRYLVMNREEGERCPACGGTIKRTVVFGRTTYYCGRHQK